MFVTKYKDWYIRYDEGNGLWAEDTSFNRSTVLHSGAIRFLQIMKCISSNPEGTVESSIYEHNLLLRLGLIAVEDIRMSCFKEGPRTTHYVLRLALGNEFLEQIPVRLLIFNLTDGMNYKAYRKEQWNENWIIAADQELWEATAFYMSKLSIDELPLFLVHEHPMVCSLAAERSRGVCVFEFKNVLMRR